ncbi:ATP-binding protein [Rubrolithibacter danxiaensis]|uniref:ATP-binding protein n=1 Tax=Rubrolithibacter danxiaensis TaxID=3390805 RepID=UPI003BF806A8
MFLFSLPKQYFQFVTDRVTKQDADPINQARIKMLVFGLSVNLFFAGLSVIIYLISGPYLQFIRSLIVFTVGGILFISVLKWPIWRQVSHTLMALLTVLIWSNIFIYVQGTNIPTLQFVFIIIVYTFYVHGLRWGVFYALANILPIFIYTLLGGKDYFSFNIQPQVINKPAYILVLCYNFSLIIFLHYHFFKAFIKNISKLTRAGEELKELNSRLQHTMTDLEKSSNAKIDFLSAMSHELRTPLNGVIGLSNVLLLHQPREDQKENLGILKFSAENLLALINDILDFNKLESGKIELEAIPFNLSQLLNNICGGLRIRADEKDLNLSLVIDPELKNTTVFGDPTRLTQVLVNLINNAIKFTETGSVTVKAAVVKRDQSELTVDFFIEDTGIGIETTALETIFDPFTQASKSINRKFGGTGLGLSIVKGILEKMDSKINLRSVSGQGTTFYFTVSFGYKPEVDSEKDREAVTELSKPLNFLKVLVAEDNPINVLVIKKLFSTWNISPLFAGNGREAIDVLLSEDFDMILMDLHMPEMDGFEAAVEIRQLQDKQKSEIPIIALTASVSEDIKEKVKACGMNDYLSKPFNPDDLKEKLALYSVVENYSI